MVAPHTSCSLCGQPVFSPVRGEGGSVYCCHACKEVAALLAESPAPAPAPPVPADAAEQVTLELSGLWCASCAWLVEERLVRTPGVTSARVSFLERRARIGFDARRTNPKVLRKRIRGLGYQAEPAGTVDEADRFFTRMLVGGLLAMHIMVVSVIMYVRTWLGLSGPDTAWLEYFFHLMQAVLSVPLSLLLGLPILRAGLVSLLRGLPNVQTLVALGALAALSLSVRNLLNGGEHVYFDTAAMLFFLLTVGRWLEIKAHQSGRSAFEALHAALPAKAHLLRPDGEIEVPAADLLPGQRIRILPGEQVPADGLIALGEAELDESILTGEPEPVLRSPGGTVLAGSRSLDGALEVIVTRAGAASRVGQIQALLENLLWERSASEKLADRYAARMVYAAVVIAALTFGFWYVRAGLETALLNALAVLLIACPCALGVATPLTLWQAVGKALQNGVLLRSNRVLEELAEIRQVFFDKTGTLTQLPHHVAGSYPDQAGDDAFVLRAAALEKLSGHPFAAAILAACPRSLDELPEVRDFRSVPGAGVQGEIDGETVWAGNAKFMQAQGQSLPDALRSVEEARSRAGGSCVHVAWGGRVRGTFVIGERLRSEAPAVLKALGALGVSAAILTGDTKAAGARWQEQLGIPVFSGLDPEEKLAILRGAQGAAMMVGDGINDGPALAAAGVGVAMLHGAEIAQSASDVTLLDGDLRALPWLVRLSLETRRRLRQNLAWALVYNLVGIGLAVAGLLQPVLAASAMVLSSTFVTRNALRLRRIPGWKEAAESAPEALPAPLPAIRTSPQESR